MLKVLIADDEEKICQLKRSNFQKKLAGFNSK